MDDFVTCESTAAIVVHIRRIGDRGINIHGHTHPRPEALCGAKVAWDTRIPLAGATCRRCIAERRK